MVRGSIEIDCVEDIGESSGDAGEPDQQVQVELGLVLGVHLYKGLWSWNKCF